MAAGCGISATQAAQRADSGQGIACTPAHQASAFILANLEYVLRVLGIQFGFALQNANVSRIFQTLGAGMDDIPILWVAAPLTGLLVQPLISGYL